jgi:twitching motility protein PilT
LARYRANYFQQKWGVGAVFREIPSTILTSEQLGLPKVITNLFMLHKGMVLVTGPTGSGKSTTLAAMMDYVNRNKKKPYYHRRRSG